MSSFTTPLQAELVFQEYEKRPTWFERIFLKKPIRTYEKQNVWKLTEAFEYYRTDDETSVIKVHKGFVTDLATIPRCFWSIFPPFGEYAKAAVIHDFLYYYAIGTKKEADIIFKEAMKVLGVNVFTRQLLYWSVRLVGEGNFNLPKERIPKLP